MIRVNDVTIDADTIAGEAALHAGLPDPDSVARRALAVRELLLQRAGELGLLEGGAPRRSVSFASRAAEDEVVERVLDREAVVPEPTEAECRRFHAANPERFAAGELVEARHILFAVVPGVPVSALRDLAERTRAELADRPALFGERAAELSNCPSGAQGGSLGQFGRGTMVAEFDAAVFGNASVGVLPALVTSRYGFHVVLVERRIPGRPLDFEVVREQVARALRDRAQQRALAQYVKVLAGRARLEGVRLDAAATPLVQ